nr:immunoglobulin heavy chain junction region [Macaca mulatta]
CARLVLSATSWSGRFDIW